MKSFNGYIAGNACTFSKRPDQYIRGVYPVDANNDNGYYIQCNGAQYIDTVSALGANTYGAAGMTSLPNVLEAALARALVDKVNCIEMVRYMCNGGDATEAAIRYARAFTGRTWIWSTGYHGSAGHWTSVTPPALGCVPSRICKYDDMEHLVLALENCPDDHDIAACIIEPIELDLDTRDLLKRIRDNCTRLSIVLIFDEIITGWRVPYYTVSNWYGVDPDLICLGKALGGGHPLGILGGKKYIMSIDEVFVSYTFAGYGPALHAALHIISEVTGDKFWAWWERCERFFNWVNDNHPIRLHGYPTRATWVGDQVHVFWQEMLKEKYFIGRAYFPRFIWDNLDFANMRRAMDSVFKRLSTCSLEGKPPVELFKRY